MNIRTIPAVLLILSLASPLHAQSSGFSASDSKELASYRLTMETTKRVYALMQDVAREMANDPRVQALQKVKAEIETLQKKDDLTDAEAARLEQLQMQAEQQEEAIDRGNASEFSKAQTLDEMETAIKANPRFMAALSKAGLSARDYSKFMVASLMAGMVAGFQKSGLIKDLPAELKEVNPENVKFMQEHEAELTAMRQEMEKAAR